MGSINSSHRRRRMSSSLDVSSSQREDLGTHQEGAEGGNGEEVADRHVEEDQADSDHHDLSSILAYLIRSGQVRILRSDDRGDSYSDDEEFCEEQRLPAVDPNPDTTRIMNNDIYEEIMLRSGRSNAFDKSHPTVAHMLYKRQIGMRKQIKFAASDRRVISTPYLPNYCDSVANYRQKAFCGTYSVDGNIFLSASQDQNIRIYDTTEDRFELMKSIRAKDVGWSVLDTAFSPDGNYMIYSSWSDCIHLCNVHGDQDVHQALHLFPTENSFCIFSLTFSSDNREILGGANDGHLYVFDRDSNQRSLKIDAHDDDVNAVAFADTTSQILFSGGDDGLCKVWDRRTLKEDHPVPVGVLAGHYDGITYIDPKGDARYLLSNSKDQTMKLWDIRMFSSSTAIEQTKKAVSKQRWDYRWQQVPKKMDKHRRLPGDTSVMTYKGHSVLHTLIRCHFSPEFTTGQRYVYTGCAMGNLIIYDTLTGQIVRKLEGHRQCVRDVSWHPYENNIVTTSWDGSLRKWEYKSVDRLAEVEDEESSSSDEEYHLFSRSRRLQQRAKCNKRQRQESWCQNADKKFRGLFD
ncbi:DDB1- and CUL4-associated factor 11-like isoform X2 [Ruditapes philippinarum]|uniref:DDB1- and CUL4-associated factor 11-like isoform X2 n=1 Tax=Ruditapes philippinarum TaxID=129788 RepID=UPI00295B6824|nr:DDB1- and CUL4-associated factor 11-like isoform X2 [Ruditapes philippinarum]